MIPQQSPATGMWKERELVRWLRGRGSSLARGAPVSELCAFGGEGGAGDTGPGSELPLSPPHRQRGRGCHCRAQHGEGSSGKTRPAKRPRLGVRNGPAKSGALSGRRHPPVAPPTHLVSLTPELSLLSPSRDSDSGFRAHTSRQSTPCLGGEGVRKVVQLTDLPPRSSGGRVAVPWRRRATLRPPRWRDRRPRISLLGQGPRWPWHDPGDAEPRTPWERRPARLALSCLPWEEWLCLIKLFHPHLWDVFNHLGQWLM